MNLLLQLFFFLQLLKYYQILFLANRNVVIIIIITQVYEGVSEGRFIPFQMVILVIVVQIILNKQFVIQIRQNLILVFLEMCGEFFLGQHLVYINQLCGFSVNLCIINSEC
eukprot:TRINITY_DN3678_c3_g2_i1.p7 TRINITY_DN3678_c3_g2~~TRINITY_DN3678_c3_g2_i1.p7  ORF type:complete len:111 (+),score=0.24 TRINITY_DN3678_c3_g2_i1:817-1149(+)